MKKVLITGIDSFTGKHLSSYLQNFTYDVYGTSLFNESEKKYRCDITNKDDIEKVLKSVNPDILIHLAGISFAAHGNNEEFYKINTIGTINILDSVTKLGLKLEKIILASSATVYGNQGVSILDESLSPMPANHYGASKHAMECLAKNHFNKLNIIITRPFNYTGVGQAEQFLIPKIIMHYKNAAKSIELGNLDVSREFNDIGFICETYKQLIESDYKSEIVNIASNRGINLLDVIDQMNEIAGYKIEIKVNQKFVRKDEIKNLTGSSSKLFKIIGEVGQIDFKNTLKTMYES